MLPCGRWKCPVDHSPPNPAVTRITSSPFSPIHKDVLQLYSSSVWMWMDGEDWVGQEGWAEPENQADTTGEDAPLHLYVLPANSTEFSEGRTVLVRFSTAKDDQIMVWRSQPLELVKKHKELICAQKPENFYAKTVEPSFLLTKRQRMCRTQEQLSNPRLSRTLPPALRIHNQTKQPVFSLRKQITFSQPCNSKLNIFPLKNWIFCHT